MLNAPNHVVELAATDALHGHTMMLRQLNEVIEATTIGDEEALHFTTGAQCFAHGVPPEDSVCATHAISAAMARAAATGSRASRIGRPITSQVAPADKASRGVATRF